MEHPAYKRNPQNLSAGPHGTIFHHQDDIRSTLACYLTMMRSSKCGEDDGRTLFYACRIARKAHPHRSAGLAATVRRAPDQRMPAYNRSASFATQQDGCWEEPGINKSILLLQLTSMQHQTASDTDRDAMCCLGTINPVTPCSSIPRCMPQ
jgi:hypothetical protein